MFVAQFKYLNLKMPKKVSRAGTRKRPMGRTRKHKKRKVSFKNKQLRSFPAPSRPINTLYETTINGTTTLATCPALGIARLIACSNTATQQDTRAGQRIHLKGFRFRSHFENRLLRPQVVHIAFVTPKDGRLPGGDVPFGQSFFKRLGLGATGNDRTDVDFGDVALNGIHYATLPINTDEYTVIWHMRFKLGVTSTTGGYSSGELKNYRSVYRYVKINKTIEFPESTSSLPDKNQQIYMVKWACPWDYDPVTQEPVDEGLQYQTHVAMVFSRL